MALHATNSGWLLLLLSGFGMSAKTGIGFPVWMMVKLGIAARNLLLAGGL